MYNSSSGFRFSARRTLRQTTMDYAKETTRAPTMFPQILMFVTVILSNCIHPGDSAAPSSLTPSVAVKPAYASVTELYIGSKVEFTLTVAFPTGTTEGVVVEILPSTNVTVMAVGAVTMSRGSNLNIDPNTKMVYHPTEDSKDTAFKVYTRGVYNFSNVQNSGASNTDADNNLVIDYEAYVVSVDGVIDGAIHWVSSGIEYNNSYNVWIGQVSYTMKTSNPAITKTPVYNLTSPDSATSLKKGELLTVTFEAWMPYPSPDIAVEAINLHSDTNNNHLQIVSLHVKSVGANIDGTTAAPQVNLEKMTSVGVACNSSWTGSRRVRLVLPTTLTNKESRSTSVATSTADDKIEFEAMVLMTTDAVEGDVYPVGFGIEVDTAEVWVFYFNLTADPPSTSSSTMSMAIGDVNNTACIGGVTDFTINITTVESGLTTFTLTVEVVEKTSSKPAGVMVAHMEVLESGQNILCMETNVTKSSTTSATAIENSASMYFNISNFGTMSHIGGNNTITVKVLLVPMPGYAFLGDDHQIKVGISGHTTANDDTNEIAIACENPPDTPVDYTFNFYHNCTRTCLMRGSVFEFILDITTERNKNPGQVNLELAVPTNDSESFFVLCGYEVTKIGSNLKCLNNDTITAATNTSLLPDGTYSKVDVVFPVMCNLGIVNDTEEDKVQVRLTVKIRNDTSINSSRDEWFGLGSRYSTTQVWVGQYKLCIRAPDYYADLARVDGVAIDPADLVGAFPGVRGIEYSFDGVEFKDKSVIFTVDGTNGSVYNIDKPFITKYVGMTNQPNQTCEKSCYVNHEMVVTKLDDYIEIFNDESGDLKSKIPYALDGDNSTCFALPVQGDTPPLFWTRMNTSVILGISASQFDITITGEGISCAKHSNNRVLQVTTPASLQVSYPESSSVGKFHGNIQFCTSTITDTSSPLAACQFRCACPDPAHCEEVIIFLANEDNGTTWKLCEISATNY